MPNFRFRMGVNLRCYGDVEVEADTVNEAIAELTADNVGEGFEITETTTDSGQDLAIIDVTDADTGDRIEDYDDDLLPPNPYDPEPEPVFDDAHSTVDALTQAERFIEGFEGDEMQEGIADLLAIIRGAIRAERAKPAMIDVLRSAINAWPQFEVETVMLSPGCIPEELEEPAEVNGGDMVEWFGEWRQEAKAVLAGIV